MAIPLERFIQQIEETGIIAEDTLKEFIPPKGTSKDAEGLARELVRQKKLTKYQAEEVYRGNGRSLTLGNYLLMEKIGAGGMGQVFKAQHRRMKRIVAIKLLPAAMTKDKEAIARFEREVEAAAKISHPNIVAAFDADCANGVHFLVMELVDGKDLSALVKKNGPFSVGKTIVYILQAAKGLEAAHKKGIVHRDIKPANLLLDSEGTVKILDMGLARLNGEADAPAQAELTSTGTVMGTVDYMAPEQALNTKTADARADIYALGCTLWYLLTGKSTYDGDTLMAKLLAHRDQPIPSLRSASPDIPEQLDAVFHKMVAKKTEDRYQNMTQLIAELEKCRQGDDSTVIGRDLVLPPAEPDMMDFLRELSATQPASAKKTPAVTQSLMKQTAAKTPNGNDKKKLLIGGGLLALFILLAGIVVSLKTKDGTLVVTVSEADADVQVLNEAGQVEVTRKGEKGPITIAVDPGKHRLRVTKEGFEFFTQDFSIESGGNQPITAKLVPLEEKPPAIVTTPPQPTIEKPRSNLEASTTPDRRVAEWVLANGGKCDVFTLDTFNYLRLEPGDRLPNSLFGVLIIEGPVTMKNSDLEMTSGLQHLTRLYLRSPSVDSGAITKLLHLKTLLEISTYESNIRTAELKRLDVLPFLTSMDLRHEQVDDHWAFLGALHSLWNLSLAGPNPNQQDFVDWCAFPQLHTIRFGSKESIDPAIVEEFQKKRPGCRLVSGYPPTSLVLGKDPVRQAIHQLLPKGVEFEIQHNGETRRVERGSLTLPPEGEYFLLTKVFIPKDVPYLPEDLLPLENCSFDTLDLQGRKQADSLLQALPPNLAVYEYNLSGSDATNGGLKHLDGRLALKNLHVQTTQITPEEATAFHSRNPYCHIIGDFGAIWPSWSVSSSVNDRPAVMEKPLAVAGEKEKQKLAFENPGFDQWVKDVSGLPAEQQVEAVSKKLMELNPGFDGKVTPTFESSVVTELRFETDHVSDLSPIQVFHQLRILDITSTRSYGKLVSLAPLSGLPLVHLSCASTSVSDLSPLRGMPLKFLRCFATQVSDLSPLAGLPLEHLDCGRIPASDAAPLKGLPLKFLNIQLTRITDLSPLQGMPLDGLYFDFRPKRDIDLLRSITSLSGINGQTAADFWKDVAEYTDPLETLNDPAFQQWLKYVSTLSAEEQVVAVTKKLQELNPSFNGEVEHTIDAGVVKSLKFVSDDVWNIAPVRGLTGLISLDCSGSKLDEREGKVVDLSPLVGLQLYNFVCIGTLVFDLSPLRGMPLNTLTFGSGPVFDLSPLQGMPLTGLNLNLTPLKDVSQLKGLSLTSLSIGGTFVTDLSPLRGMPLNVLHLHDSPVSDLSPVAGMPLGLLKCDNTNVTDLTQIKDLSIKYLWLDFQPARDTALLRSMPTLEYINDKPVAEFWKEIEEHQKGKKLGFQMPGFEQWVKEVSALTPDQQVEAVSKKLVELNPGFDGKVTPLIHQGVVFYLQFLTDHVTDISPVRALPSMYELRCDGSVTGEVGHGELSDLSPLKGLPIRSLACNYTAVSDLSPLAGMPLDTLHCGLTPVSDLSPLRGMPLTGLICLRTQVSDLSPLKGMGLKHLEVQFSATSDLSPLIGMPLSYLMFHATHVTDTSPLKNLPLKHLYLDFQPERDTALLRSLKTLEMISAKPTAEFWKEVELRDAGQKQVEAFAKKMMELNPGFDGKVTPGFESGKLIRLQFLSNHVTDISPLREFQDLRELDMASTIPYGMLADLTPLKDLQLTALSIPSTRVADLSPLRGMPLAYLNCSGTRVSDLTPLVDSPLTRLSLIHTLVSDLRPLQGKQLIDLNLLFSRVADISLLRGMPLQRLTFDFRPQRDIEILKSISTLTDINNTPSTDFWKELAEYSDASKTLADPAFQQWLTDVAVLKAEEQVVAVTKKLQELNPSYDGKEEHSIDAGVVTSLKFVSDKVWNIAPVRGLTGLKTFDCSGSDADGREGKVSDLSPLSGLSLTELKCVGTLVYDLAPLKGMPLNRLDYGSGPAFDLTPLQGMPLTWLNFSLTPVSDLTPIKGLPLTYLQLDGTLVTDVTPLQGMALTQFHLRNSPVSDLAPLAGMPLGILGFQGSGVTDLTQIKDLPIKYLWIDFQPSRDTALLRSMPTLEYINDKPVAEFWKEVEAGGK